MKKIIEYILYIYIDFIVPNRYDLCIYKDKFKLIAVIITEWINIYIWIFSIIFFPYFIGSIFIDKFKKTNNYKNIINLVENKL
jgi:hypothetical protein